MIGQDRQTKKSIGKFFAAQLDLAKRAGKRGLGDRLAILLALEMDGAMNTLLQPEADPEKRWQREAPL